MNNQLSLFENPPARRRSPRVMMHVCDAGPDDFSDSHRVRMQCAACGHETDWFTVETVTEGRRGKPCPVCNRDADFQSGAEFSPCRTWRYVLWRRWAWHGYANQVMFIGLNPSTADETADDPTIRRCIRFAQDWGYSGLLMMNAYAFRATDPKVMKAAVDPIGPGNDEALSYRRTQVGLVVAAWGAHCDPDRARQVCEAIGKSVHCLGRTKSGQPRHPLYLRADSKPEIWTP